MAVDSKAKRASVQSYLLGAMRPPPDGTVGAGDRATVAWHYSGITYSTTAPPVVAAGLGLVRALVRNLVGNLVRPLTA